MLLRTPMTVLSHLLLKLEIWTRVLTDECANRRIWHSTWSSREAMEWVDRSSSFELYFSPWESISWPFSSNFLVWYLCVFFCFCYAFFFYFVLGDIMLVCFCFCFVGDLLARFLWGFEASCRILLSFLVMFSLSLFYIIVIAMRALHALSVEGVEIYV